MTDAEMKIAVAEFCGWIKYFEPAPLAEEGVGSWWWHKGNENKQHPPDYPNDLNAMHEAEDKLNPLDRGEFIEHLTDVIEENPDADYDWDTIHATAHQRCKALLRTIGKLKD